MKRIKKRFFLILVAFVFFAAIYACLFFWTKQPVPTAYSTHSGNTFTQEKESMDTESSVNSEDITIGTQSQRGFLNDNTLHSSIGDIHYSSYIPETYNGSEPYALFITLPGWERLYFQGVGANMVEDFGTEAINYNDRMIILSTQLDDWGETSADQAIALTEYFLEHYNIDSEKVYLHGMSGGGETGSLVMGKRPELYTAYLMTSSRWDGSLDMLAKARTPVYMAIAENDSYYGSGSLKEAFAELHALYEKRGLSEEEINRLLVLDGKEDSYFTERGFRDQHAGGQAFAHDETVWDGCSGSIKLTGTAGAFS